MSATASREAVAWERLRRSGLVEPFSDPVAVAGAMIGVQSQFVPPAGLAIRHRLAQPFTAADLDRHLHERRDLLRLWGQRRTVHVYDTRDWPTMVAASRSLPSYRGRLVDLLGKTEEELEAALETIARLLEREGRMCRAEMLIAEPSLEPWFQYGTGMMMELVRRGTACHAGLEGGRSYFAWRETWRPDLDWKPPSASEAGAALARRYFRSYGPATASDFVFWTGARASDARAWIEEVRSELTEVAVEGETMYVAGPLDPAPPPRSSWPVLFVHRFDPMLLAHKDKRWIVDDEFYKAVWRKAGYVEASVLRKGRIVGTWGYERKGRKVGVWLTPFDRFTADVTRAAEPAAEGVADYLGLPLGGLHFR